MELNSMSKTDFWKMSAKEVSEAFKKFLDEMDWSPQVKQKLLDKPLDEKIKLLQMKSVTEESNWKKIEHYVKIFQENSRADSLNLVMLQVNMKALKQDLRSNFLSFVQDFGERGIEEIYQVLYVGLRNNNSDLQWDALSCIEQFLVDCQCLEKFSQYDKGHEILVLCLNTESAKVMIKALSLLSSLCNVNDDKTNPGCTKILGALTKVAQLKDVSRFSPITDGINQRLDKELQGACLVFINTLLSAIDDLKFRINIRNEILRHEIEGSLFCDNSDCSKVQEELNVFNVQKLKDLETMQMAKDLRSVDSCVEELNKTSGSDDRRCFENIVRNVMVLVKKSNYVEADNSCGYMKILDDCVSQMVLHKSSLDQEFEHKYFQGMDPEFFDKYFKFDLHSVLDRNKDK